MTDKQNNRIEDLPSKIGSPEFETTRKTYREKLADCLLSMRQYDGTKKAYEELLSCLINFENWLKEMFGEVGRLTETQEREVNEIFSPESETKSIDDILAETSTQLEKYLQRSSRMNEEGLPDGIYVIQLDGVVLPAGKISKTSGPRDERDRERYRYSPRLKLLILFLNKHGIFIDDLIVRKSKVDPSMMRKEPYFVVEIPRINREVLVCNQVGEATFAIDGTFSQERLTTTPKEELVQLEGVRKILRKNNKQWEDDLREALFSGGVGTESSWKKIDIKSAEQIRTLVREKLPTSADWIGLSTRDRGEFKVQSLGMTAIARVFGIEGNPNHNNLIYFEVGKKIYGDDDAILAKAIGEYHEFQKTVKMTREEILPIITKEFPTSQAWVGIDQKKRNDLKFGGVGLSIIARKFSVKGHPSNNLLVHYELGLGIYGAEDKILKDCIKKIEENEKNDKLTQSEIKALILIQIPTADKWIKMTQRERGKFKISNLGLSAISSKFGPRLDPVNKYADHLLLAVKIYGEDNLAVQKALMEERDRSEKLSMKKEQWVILLKEKVPTSAEWIRMTANDRPKFKIGGIGLVAIATICGVQGNVIQRNDAFYELGAIVYGEDDPIIQKAFESQKLAAFSKENPVIKTAIVEQEKLEVSTETETEIVIASIRKQLPTSEELQSEIEATALLREIEYRENLRITIKSEIPTGEEWFSIGYKDRKNKKIAGFSLYQLAGRFGTPRNVGNDNLGFYLLGAEIYGPEDKTIAKLKPKMDELMQAREITPEKVIATIKETYTAKQWVNMSTKEKQQLIIWGLNLHGLAIKLGRPDLIHAGSDHLLHYRLGAMIYGENDINIKQAIDCSITIRCKSLF